MRWQAHPPLVRGGGVSLVNPFLVRILMFKFIIDSPANDDKNLLRPKLYIYKLMTSLPQDYYLIPGNGAKNLLRQECAYEVMIQPLKDYSVPDNGAKNLLNKMLV